MYIEEDSTKKPLDISTTKKILGVTLFSQLQSSGWFVEVVDICVNECCSVDTPGPPERTS
jgi:hypothetical protein